MASTTSLRPANSDSRATDPSFTILTIDNIVGETNEDFDYDSDPGFPSLETLGVLHKVGKKSESYWNLWLKVCELKKGNCSGLLMSPDSVGRN